MLLMKSLQENYKSTSLCQVYLEGFISSFHFITYCNTNKGFTFFSNVKSINPNETIQIAPAPRTATALQPGASI